MVLSISALLVRCSCSLVGAYRIFASLAARVSAHRPPCAIHLRTLSVLAIDSDARISGQEDYWRR
jgi:hypothetical protein